MVMRRENLLLELTTRALVLADILLTHDAQVGVVIAPVHDLLRVLRPSHIVGLGISVGGMTIRAHDGVGVVHRRDRPNERRIGRTRERFEREGRSRGSRISGGGERLELFATLDEFKGCEVDKLERVAVREGWFVPRAGNFFMGPIVQDRRHLWIPIYYKLGSRFYYPADHLVYLYF